MKNSPKKSSIFSITELNYMNDLMASTKMPFLTNIEILENIKNYRINKDSIYLDRVINNFIKLLIKKARKYKKPGVNVGDLIHYGVEGMIEAINKTFNLDGKERFITYITIIIERRMKDGLDAQKGAVNFPKNILTQQRKARHRVQNSLPNVDTIYSKINVDDFILFKDILAIEQLDVDENSIEHQFDVYRVLEGLLTPIEKDVIIHSFGLNGESTKAFDAISLLLNVSSQKVRKIRNTALSKIKRNAQSMRVLKKYLI